MLHKAPRGAHSSQVRAPSSLHPTPPTSLWYPKYLFHIQSCTFTLQEEGSHSHFLLISTKIRFVFLLNLTGELYELGQYCRQVLYIHGTGTEQPNLTSTTCALNQFANFPHIAVVEAVFFFLSFLNKTKLFL